MEHIENYAAEKNRIRSRAHRNARQAIYVRNFNPDEPEYAGCSRILPDTSL